MVQATEIRRYGNDAIARAATLIEAGEAVAIATETVYGLAADATSGESVARIFAIKGRPAFNPLIVHVADLAAAERIGVFDDVARALAVRYWPGPLTIVVPRRPGSDIASLATAGLDTIAIRVPAHRAIVALLAATGRPLAAPSANASGQLSPTRADHVATSLGERVALIVDDGPCPIGIESTIVAINDGRVRLLRAGSIEVGDALSVPANGPIEAPGQLASHYAPRKPLRLGATECLDDEWLIGFGDVGGTSSLSVDGNVIEAAAKLFDKLHEADASTAHAIAIAPVPMAGIGLAINDRLTRAAART